MIVAMSNEERQVARRVPDDLGPSFTRDGDLLTPSESTEGGWNQGTLMGRYLAGLIAYAAERHAAAGWQPARLTVDMFRPAPLGPTRLDTRVVRDGRRIRVVDVDVVVAGAAVCRGTVAFLHRSATPRGDAWLPGATTLPDPGSIAPYRPDGWTPAWDQRLLGDWGDDHPTGRGCWIGETRPFVDGEITSPFVLAALAADNANGAINGTTIGLPYINADLTMTLARLPAGDWVGLVPVSRATADGVSVGTVDLFDLEGRVGQVAMIALADERSLRS
jgi:hypothetical protein